jgi:Protein of unknown function (DUF3053)
MFSMQRRNFLCALIGFAVLALAGCGDAEEQQAKAFADFLDHRILEKPGLHVPTLSDGERTSFGKFAQDYAILSVFHDDLNEAVKDFATPMHPPPPGASVADFAKMRPDFATAREVMTKVGDSLDGALARAQAGRAALKQPDIVKTRFDQAFDRMVVTPHKVMREIVPPTVELLDAEIAIADFVGAHKADITTVGQQMQVTKPDILNRLQKLLDTYNAKVPQMGEIRRKMESLNRGP